MTGNSGQGVFKRILRKTTSVLLTVAVIGASVAAVTFGAQALANRADDVPPPAPAALTKVAVAPLVPQDGYLFEHRYVGQTEAGAIVPLSFELGGRLVALNAEEGQSVRAGEVLMRLDTALLEADKVRLTASRAAVSSQLDFATSRLTRAEALRQDGFTSQETLDQVRATRDELQSRMDEIDASLASVRINLEKSVVTAPFDGRIGSQFVEQGTALSAGQPVANVIETGRVQVRIGLPLDLPEGALDDARVEVAGMTYPAALIQYRPDIDPVTRTRTALFEVKTEAAAETLFGQSATLEVQTTVPMRGVWVQTDALQEGAGGAWSVLMVEEDVVRPALVEILHTDGPRAFVRGTFSPGALMIREGAHRVVPGQTVDVQQAEG